MKAQISLATLYVLALFIAACYDETASDEEIGRHDLGLIFAPSESWDKISVFAQDEDYWPATQYAKASGRLVIPIPGGTRSCSATLIHGLYLATAQHCVRDVDEFDDLSFIAAPFEHPNQSSQDVLQRRLEALGFRGTALTNAIAEVNSDDGPVGDWRCNFREQDGGRDVAYLDCFYKVFEYSPASYMVLGPGDIFGFVDPEVYTPPTNTPITSISANSTQSMIDNNEPRPVELISPNGYAQNNGSLSCDYGPGQNYVDCLGTQGNDVLGGSSGGIVLNRENHKAYAVISGHMNYKDRSPVPFGGSQYYNNKNLVAPFSSIVNEYAYLSDIGHITTPPNVRITSTYATKKGTKYSAACSNTEAMLGVTGSSVLPLFSFTGVLGSLGSICNDMYPILAKIFRDMYVQTPGAADTGHYATPPANSPDRVGLYRYLSTTPSNIVVILIPGLAEQNFVMCPGNRAVYKITSAVKNDEVIGITSIGCRSKEGLPDIDVDVVQSRLGNEGSGSSSVTRSCSGNRVAIGLDIWVDGRTKDFQIRCRDW